MSRALRLALRNAWWDHARVALAIGGEEADYHLDALEALHAIQVRSDLTEGNAS